MEDDTKKLIQPGTVSQSPFLQSVDAILSHRIIRADATRWADSLRFLTFDDGTDDNVLTTGTKKPDIYGQCQPCEARQPIPSGHICAQHDYPGQAVPPHLKERESRLHEYFNPCVHVQEHLCRDCRHIPPFPNEGKVSKFRIRRVYKQGELKRSNCGHFVAVSYCWDAQGNGGTSKPTYKITEEDGKQRDMRAPDVVIDRVIAFAHENGFRMIWIDQVRI